MNCKEFQRQITGFLNDELDVQSLEVFLDHVESCKNCREELTIQFLVETGTRRLEDGTTFNLKYELDNLMQNARQRLNFRKRLQKMAFALHIIAIIEIIVVVTLSIVL
ncbi:anti-sigma factor family protein [Butyrivibrio sp. NC2002]|uniref:anti-sigma factor family protein n=1 Tax=Butyrivibrio sp. NC2002 TaxID=1410610 RepID=UPI0005604E74|nr:zf-HC2 domain-containing protein [Butyrivibrio sp. NC2002]